jgi:acetyl-CoA carboxylase/biotin carboxylase 1
MGPGDVAMAALGDKIASTLIAQSCGVPCVSWSGQGIKVNFKDTGTVDEKSFQDSCVTSAEHASAVGEKMGFPIMVKASEGGGGKGIRVVKELSQMAAAYRQVAGEVPGSPIFLMTMMSGARHLEVQLMADMHGNAIALSGRDCSVQRRHQKIIEEGPQVAAPPETWVKMEAAAVALAKEVGYKCAGTVEYLYVPAIDEFYFLELNPRLQVEHPCSEWITRTNIPAIMLNVTMGIPLDRIPDIRNFYAKPTYGPEPIDFSTEKGVVKGHVVAGRITAENPEEGFQPTSGTITELTFRNTPNVWGYFSTYAGVHEYSDSQFGHVFAWGETREAARRTMVCALMELNIRGDIRTTVEYLITLMETEAFRDNEISTEWLDGLIANRVKTATPDVALSTICGAMYKAYVIEQEYLSGIRDCLEKGQIPPKAKSFIEFDVELILDDVKYNYQVTRRGPTLFEVSTRGSSILTEMRVLNDGALHICVDGKSHIAYAKEEPSMLRLSIDGKSVAFSREYDPTQIESVMAGKLVRNLVTTGQHVNKGDDIAELEVMKMYISVQAPESGIIENTMLEGSALAVGDLIGRLTLDDPSKVKKATLFDGLLPKMRPPIEHGNKVHQSCRAAVRHLSMIMAGYQAMNDPNWQSELGTALETLQACELNPLLGLAEIEECLSTISSRLPNSLTEQLNVLVAKGHGEHQQGKDIRYVEFQEAITACVSSLEADAQAAITATLAPMEAIVDKFVNGPVAAWTAAVRELLQMYVNVEGMFQKVKKSQTNEEMIYTLREKCSSEPGVIMENMISHKNLNNKNSLVVEMLQKVSGTDGADIDTLVDILNELASWQSADCVEVSRAAREMLLKHTADSSVVMFSGISDKLELIAASTSKADTLDHLQSVADNPAFMSNAVLGFVFSSQNPKIQAAALHAYVLRIYKGYVVSNWTEVDNTPGALLCTKWNFAAGEADGGRPSSPMRSLDRSIGSFEDSTVQRMGEIVVLDSIASMKRSLGDILEAYAAITTAGNVSEIRPMNSLNLFMRNEADGTREDARIADIHMTLTAHKALLRKCSLRSVTVVLVCDDSSHNFYSFPASMEFEENPIHRHIDPALAYQLGLERLSEFTLQRYPTKVEDYNAFYAEHESDRRFFVRTLVRTTETLSSRANVTMPGVEKAFTESLTVLENAMTDSSQRFERLNMNHIFLNVLATVETDSELEDILSDCSIVFKRMYAEHETEMDNLRVTDVEIALSVMIRDTPVPLLFTLSSPSAHLMQMYVYKEVFSSAKTQKVLEDISVQPGQVPGPMHQKAPNEPYGTLDILQQKRLRAAVLGGNYVYDFADIFSKALEGIWKAEAESMRDLGMKANPVPLRLVKSVELCLDKDGKLVEIDRPPAQNKVGMLAWRYTLCTPEYPEGRDLIVIANDITVQAGSFGPQEDYLFDAASKLARKLGIPRIYIAANSGARIGLAEEVRSCFKAAWKDASDPSKGFDYLYLTSEDYHRLSSDEAHKSKSINATKVVEGGEERWKIRDIIGEKDGLGVECLAGSGLIAGETSKAYDEIFTLTYVMSRSVGIGAYLVRLGQRVIQKKTDAPIILTGM